MYSYKVREIKRVLTYEMIPNLFHASASTYKRQKRTHCGCVEMCVCKVGRLWVSFWCSVTRSCVAGPSVNRMTTTQCVCVCERVGVCVSVYLCDTVMQWLMRQLPFLLMQNAPIPEGSKCHNAHTHAHRAATALPNYLSSQGSVMCYSHMYNVYP